MKNVLTKVAVGFSVLFMLVSFSDTAHAALFTPVVPEVDPSSMGAALALLAGSYFVAVSKFGRK